MKYFVYIMINKSLTLYTGVTSNLPRRVDEHKRRLRPKIFTAKYFINKLVYFESFEVPIQAIVREKQIKDLDRKNKIALVQESNPKLQDLILSDEFF